ncbi:hypothetical protein LOKG_00001 [Loktanella phage pCB2051-A]|uniref:Uncharacterized protein n=1 Tax=Loktanella phage pCB2051-A TaxID=754044 RepID=M4QRF6_9CAUD|nr:hypothetical protein LOKG_00001 [Loktanella phage pCB2051-A]AGH31438.1 hypothetical protein LOKG_00001 [Loktanella phage pCB2051-A]
MTEIRKGMCEGCPWDYGNPATEMAYNLGCLPSIAEATQKSKAADKSWACHSDCEKICCGFAGQEKDVSQDLYLEDGVHSKP